jgi:hypothetical protein
MLEGWILAGMRARTSTALAARGAFPKHFATYYRFFSERAWCPDALGTALLELVFPVAFVAYTITLAWFCHIGHRHYPTLPIMPWYRHKRAPSFADMQGLLRRELLQQGFSHTPANIHPFEEPRRANNHAGQRAA